MRWFWTFIIGLLLLAVQMGVISKLAVPAGGPDLLLLFVIFLALYGPMDDAPISGWLLGLAKDSLSAGTFGLYAVLFMALAFVLSRIRADIFLEYNISHAFNAALSTFFVYLGAGVWHSLDGGGILAMMPVVVGVAVWNGVLAAPAFYVFFRFSRLVNAARRPG